jgi:WD40 repeat protein
VFGPDGSKLVAWSGSTAQIWDAATGQLLFTVGSTARRAYAISKDNELVATGSSDGTVRVWDARGRQLAQLAAHRQPIKKLAFSADGARLLVQAEDGFASLWDLHAETRSPDEIARLAEQFTRWRVADGQLVPRIGGEGGSIPPNAGSR